jgi:predicted DNA-binding transcriptional regulator YafY
MKLLEVRRIYTIHRLLALNTKVNPKKLSQRLNVSRATIFRDLDKLKDIGAPISYCYITKIYFYTADFKLTIEDLINKL